MAWSFNQDPLPEYWDIPEELKFQESRRGCYSGGSPSKDQKKETTVSNLFGKKKK